MLSASSEDKDDKKKRMYSEEQVKLRGGRINRDPAFQVILPKGMDAGMTKIEREKVEQKIEAQSADPSLTDLELLKLNLKKLLESME